ncbi:L,D-transpeptidase family protein [Janthinobacterium fluminis]|uniref:L,D-transpeptidase family protein n=1 Tax=Janthinobacterium fluminis TaxID=2987524 RepID=A0ABT5K429_9BURK|nr:L,D-transpeptidase family protein [Janthinobacterium fluminis]MDC8759759.1 L,D-transpeptidase family protein [Janthinobacterium fluminis]
MNLRISRGRRPGWLLCILLLAAGGNAGANEAANWFADGRPNAAARQAVQLLQAAGGDGLDPGDYRADALALALGNAASGAAPLPEAAQAGLSADLSRAMEHLVSDLHFGRVNPRDIHAAFDIPKKQLDPASYIRLAVAGNTLPAAVRAAAPQLPLYTSLRQALRHYRTLQQHADLQTPLPPPTGKAVAAGQPYADLAGLARRLAALGDLDAATPPGAQYGGALMDGVKAFQRRHGLTPDGVLGKGTLAQLNTPVAARIRQIELTLERLRWTPLLLADRMIVVNIPEFALHAYELKEGGAHLSMNVIVGKAVNARTPLFFEDMRHIEFSPYWNIPPSIAKAETVPRLRRDPGHFDAQGLEFVGADGAAITTLSAANLDAVARGQLRIRQRPGPLNALGDIKFIFPNSDNIYLHHTPAVTLFQRERRDLSHGCIRVEAPVALAKFVLQEQPEWTEDKIRAAMGDGKSSTLRLKHPLPVLIAYGTAMVKDQQKVYFYEDIYGNDKLLDRALRAKQQAVR